MFISSKKVRYNIRFCSTNYDQEKHKKNILNTVEIKTESEIKIKSARLNEGVNVNYCLMIDEIQMFVLL
jgi:hypothetical protein